MILKNSAFGKPAIDDQSIIFESAEIIGAVIVEPDVIVYCQAVLRGDEAAPHPIMIRRGTNVQDHVLMHGLKGQFVEVQGVKFSIYISTHCTIAHHAIIHGPAYIGKKCFVGFHATVLQASLGRNCHIGHGAHVIGVNLPDYTWVPDGAKISDQAMVANLPKVTEKQLSFNQHVVDENKMILLPHYRELARL